MARPAASEHHADERCPVCGTTTGALHNQPVSDDPAVLDRVLDATRRRLEDVRAGRTQPEQVQDEVRRFCSGCRGLLAGITGRPSREELIQHLALTVRRVEARLEAMEQDQPPSAEHSPRLRGPGDRAI